jgi:Ca-activated chloride channel family protein
VAQFGMLLRNSEFKQQASFDKAFMMAKGSLGRDNEGYRTEFLQLIRRAARITKGETTIEDEKVYGIK